MPAASTLSATAPILFTRTAREARSRMTRGILAQARKSAARRLARQAAEVRAIAREEGIA